MPLWEDKPEAWHEVQPGVQRRILAHSEGVMLVLYRIAAGCRFALHTHPHVQSGTVLQGGGVFRVGDDKWTLQVGSSYCVPSNVPHELVADMAGPTVVLDVFTPRREEFLHEAVRPDLP
ncbi:MAG: cupin domain-containing protein [Thermoplasmata archaeon]